jgi:predicted nucleic acid-binding protein
MGKDQEKAGSMRIVIDTNIVYSALLNTNSKIAKIILLPKSGLNFYATDCLEAEIEEHKMALIKHSGLTNQEFNLARKLISKRVKFLNIELIPIKVFNRVREMTSRIDDDDTEFVALTEHINGRLWTGDKQLINGLKKFNWNKIITTSELYDMINYR